MSARNSHITGIDERVIKVKADVAAVLVGSASSCFLSCATSSDITSRESRRTGFAPFTDSLGLEKLLCFFNGRPPSFGIAPQSALITLA